MAFATVQSWSETPASNTEIDGVNIDEGCNPSGINNAIREAMAQIAAWTGDDTIASATTTDLSTINGQYVTISGTTTITGLGTVKAGWIKFIRFSGALTLTHNGTSLILPGAANITTAAGDTAAFVSEGSGNWRCLAYQRASGLYASTGSANTWTALQTFRTTGSNPMVIIERTDSANNVGIEFKGTGSSAFIGLHDSGVFAIGNDASLSSSPWAEFSSSGLEMLSNLDITLGGTGKLRVADGTAAAPAIAFASDTNTGFYSASADVLAVTLGGTEHSRFSGTSLLIGSTSGWANDSGTQDGFNLTKAGQIIASNTSNTTGSWRRQGTNGRMFNFYKSTTLVGGIDVDGSSTTYVTTSDGRLKVKRAGVEQEIDLDAVWAAFEPLFYNMLDGSTLEELPERLVGMVAQDLYPHLPQAVSVGHGDPGEPDFQPWGIDYSQLVPIIVARQKQFERRTNERFAALGL